MPGYGGWRFSGDAANGVPALPLSSEWEHVLIFTCCYDMVGMMFQIESWQPMWKDDSDDTFGLKAAKVGIWISIKGTVNKYFTGTVYQADSSYKSNNDSYYRGASVSVICECGLNIYQVHTGGLVDRVTGKCDEFYEQKIYLGTQETPYTWWRCCGDNHVLVGTGEQDEDDPAAWLQGMRAQGKKPDIEVRFPLEESRLFLDDGTECFVEDVHQDVIGQDKEGEDILGQPYIVSWHFIDPAGEKRVFSHFEYIPVRYQKMENFRAFAASRKSAHQDLQQIAADDTFCDMTCWGLQYNDGTLPRTIYQNSRDAAFITYGAKGAYPERAVKNYVEWETNIRVTETVALEVKDNHKFYKNNPLYHGSPHEGMLRRLGSDSKESYRQKARERNHRRRGIFGRVDGSMVTQNPDFNENGNFIGTTEMDFDWDKEMAQPDAMHRLYIDDKESWYAERLTLTTKGNEHDNTIYTRLDLRLGFRL